MKSWVSVLLLVLGLAVVSCASESNTWDRDADGVIKLNQNTFNSFLKTQKATVIAFISPSNENMLHLTDMVFY